MKTKKRSRDLKETRARILKIAFAEVYTHGFQGVSIDDIVKKTKLTKGAFYHHFPTKLALGYALVDEVITPMVLNRWISPLSEFKNPMKGILYQMQKLIGESSTNSLRFGCPLNNLVQEMAPLDKGFATRLKNALNLWIEETKKQIERAQEEGYIKNDVAAKDLAQFVVMAHEGFYGILKGLQDKSAFNGLYCSLERYFETLASDSYGDSSS